VADSPDHSVLSGGAAARPFFYGSLLNFLAVQLTYALLFTATWAKHRGVRGKLATFALALPFSQLVPLFAFAESFHLKAVGMCCFSHACPVGAGGRSHQRMSRRKPRHALM